MKLCQIRRFLRHRTQIYAGQLGRNLVEGVARVWNAMKHAAYFLIFVVGCGSEQPRSDPKSVGPESISQPPPGLTAYTEAEVQKILLDRRHGCVDCHNSRSDYHMDLNHFAMDTFGVKPEAGGKCGRSAFRLRIAPGDREASLLWHKVQGTQDCGGTMPAGGADHLDAIEIERLGLYIDALPK